MNPALFALFLRSLRDDTRSRAMVWARSGMAVTILFAMLQFHLLRMVGATGRDFFAMVVAINAGFICVAALSYFAGAITEEKEEGTLGLLRMTDLNPLTILLGKSTSRLCGGLLLLLVQFPFSLLAVTLGGLRWAQASACYVLLAAFLFFAANAGLLGSVLARRTPVAAIVTACIAVPFVLGGNVAEEMLNAAFSGDWQSWQDGHPALAGFVGYWQQASVGHAVREVLYDQTPGWSPIGTTVLLMAGGCAAFLIAWLLFDRFCADEGAVASRLRPRTLAWMRFFSQRDHGRAWRGWRMEAVMWKDFQFLHGGWPMVAAKVGFYILLGALLLFTGAGYTTFDWDDFFPTMAATTFLLLSAESLFAASRIFRIERNQKTLSGLFALPHDVSDLIVAKRNAVLLSLLPAGVFFVVSITAAIALNIASLLPPTSLEFANSFAYLLMAVIGAVGQIFLNLRLVAWFSLRMKRGGLPLAVTFSYLANMFAAQFAFFAIPELGFVLLPAGSWLAAVALKGPLHRRIELAAAEE